MSRAESKTRKREKREPQEEPVVQPGPAQATAEIEALRKELKEQTEKSKHHLDQWQRTAANLENYRKHVERERAEVIRSSKAAVIVQLLPILDDLERAFQTVPFPLSALTWTEGLALVDRKLQIVLQQQGLKEIEAVGQPFDPSRHEALLEEQTAAYPDGHVVAVLQKGYMLDDRVLRPAMVKVARNAQSGPRATSEQTETQATPESDSQQGAKDRT